MRERNAETKIMEEKSRSKKKEISSLCLCVSVLKIWTGGVPQMGQEGPQVSHELGQLV